VGGVADVAGCVSRAILADLMGIDLVPREAMEGMIAFMRTHAAYGPAMLFAIMLLEGVIVTTFIFSGTLMILAAGALIQAGILPYGVTFAAIVLGFWAGDWLNFALGHHREAWFRNLAMVRKREALVQRAEQMLTQWGGAAVFASRFMGPLRPFVTFLAGVFRVRPVIFHAATLACTILLTAGLLNAGMTGLQLLDRLK
jgi:membrane protein DedA with SNARE-associated domain